MPSTFKSVQPLVQHLIDLQLFKLARCDFVVTFVVTELPWPGGYELRLSLKRSLFLILVKVIGGR